MKNNTGFTHFIRVRRFLLLILLTLFAQVATAAPYCPHVFRENFPAKPRFFSKLRAEAEIKQLKILAFNVENLFVSTGKQNWKKPGEQQRDESQPPKPKSPEEIERIRKIIVEQDPDFMVLTEVENLQALQVLASHSLQGKYKPLLVEGNDSRGIDIGFLVKTDLPWDTKIVSHTDIQYRDPKTNQVGPMFSRDLPVLEVRRNPTDKDPLFVLIGNHAKSKRDMDGDFESTRWRTAQYVEAARIIQQDYLSRQIPTMFAGDFNTDVVNGPEVGPIRQIMYSAFNRVEDPIPLDQRTTHSFFPGGNKAPDHKQMDDIMVSGEIRVVSAEVVKYKNADGSVRPRPNSFKERKQQPSDHNPVFVVIETQGIF